MPSSLHQQHLLLQLQYLYVSHTHYTTTYRPTAHRQLDCCIVWNAHHTVWWKSWKSSAISNRWFLGPTQVLNANGISIALVVFAWLKICQGQPPTMYSECSRFHPNRFTFTRVIAECMNTAKSCPKVNPIFGGSLASCQITRDDGMCPNTMSDTASACCSRFSKEQPVSYVDK